MDANETDTSSRLGRSDSRTSLDTAASSISISIQEPEPIKRRPPRLNSKSTSRSQSRHIPREDFEDGQLTSFPSLSPESSPVQPPSQARASLAALVARDSERQELKERQKSVDREAKARGKSRVDDLTLSVHTARGRTGLFEDSPSRKRIDLPGGLHLTDDSYLKKLIARHGAVDVVRQLAFDLARREAEIVEVRGRMQAREDELRKMLGENGVSKEEIDIRLTGLSRRNASERSSDSRRPSAASNVDALLDEALADNMSRASPSQQPLFEDDLDLEEENQATIRAKVIAEEMSSVQTTKGPKGFVKGLGMYLWGDTKTDGKNAKGTVARPANPSARRKGLEDDLFEPPTITTSDEHVGPETASQTGSTTSWTLKLFGGNTAAKETDRASERGRAGSDSKSTRTRDISQNSTGTANLGVSGMTRSTGRTTAERRKNRLSINLSDVNKSSASTYSLSLASPRGQDVEANLGPVEMDTILPSYFKPPTLADGQPDQGDLMTDRFGFIYDQHRRRRAAETASKLTVEALSNPKRKSIPDTPSKAPMQTLEPWPLTSDSNLDMDKPDKDWREHLKTTSAPTELLVHSPSSTKLLTVGTGPDSARIVLSRTPTFAGIADTLTPTIEPPRPMTSAISASQAEIAKPHASGSSTPVANQAFETEPVKLLLANLTELHDKLQNERVIKWNKFMRKVRAERRREGEASQKIADGKTMPEDDMADGEIIGIATYRRTGKNGEAKYREFKGLILGGIPVKYRAKVWMECSGAMAMRIPGYYDDLVESDVTDPIILSQIQADIKRTLTDNVYFRRGPGIAKLEEILLAYSRRNTEVGYCQGMNLIVASLLLIMPTSENVFWTLCSIIENILPRHYFDSSLIASRADQFVLREYVTEILPSLSNHLNDLEIELEAFTFQWFLSLFTDCLSAEALYRVWDVLLCTKDEDGNGGSTFLFQVALALLKLNETQLLNCGTPSEVYVYMSDQITNHAISIDGLIRASEGLRGVVTRSEVEKKRKRALKREEDTVKERERIRADGRYGSVSSTA